MTGRSPEHPEALHGVYVITHAETGEVLYVGMSNNPSEPYEVTVYAADGRDEAKRLERRLIESLRPRDNKHFRQVGPPDVAGTTAPDLPTGHTLAEFDDLMHEDYLRARAESRAP